MKQWVRLCGAAEAPAPGQLVEIGAAGRAICLANIAGVLSAVDNVCPHRQGPMAEGWIEGNAVVCPWHSWAFDVTTGVADYPENQRIDVFPLRTVGAAVEIEVEV